MHGWKMDLIKRQTWKGLSFWSEATGPSKTCGGLALLIGPTLAPYLHQHGADPDSRFLWATFHTPMGHIRFVNVYGPHTLQAREALWDRLQAAMPDVVNIRWTAGGDFNFISMAKDKQGAGRPDWEEVAGTSSVLKNLV